MKLSSLLCLVLAGMLFTSGTFQPTRRGKDYALFFAVNNYDDTGWTDLKNPIRDAEDIAKELEEVYEFETIVYRNPTKNQMLRTILSWQKKRFTEDAQLFVFVSGHGTFNEGLSQGHFVPKNGKYQDDFNETHIELSALGNAVTKIPCKHILLAIDACYSGTIDEAIAFKGKPGGRLKSPSFDERQRTIDLQLRNKTRKLLTSGGKERTPDGKEHSPFSSAILKTLREAYIQGDGMVLFTDILGELERVSPLPHQGKLIGHEGGGFVFVSPMRRVRQDESQVVPPSVVSSTPKVLDLPNAPRMIFINGGTFMMGSNVSDIEKPIHEVTVSAFYLSETEVTNAQFAVFLNTHGNQEEGGIKWYEPNGPGYNGYAKSSIKKNFNGVWEVDIGKEDYPVNYVSWFGALAYCKWLGSNYRLPTEAEWEYAAGNGLKHNKYSWGNSKPTIFAGGNIADESTKKQFSDWPIWEGYNDGYVGLSPVAQFGANELGLYDMTGSLWEWCSDWYEGDYYASSPKLNPQGPTSGSFRVIRGGGWDDIPSSLRVADRYGLSPSFRGYYLGFRPARTL